MLILADEIDVNSIACEQIASTRHLIAKALTTMPLVLSDYKKIKQPLINCTICFIG
jgi:hypothetical protein